MLGHFNLRSASFDRHRPLSHSETRSFLQAHASVWVSGTETFRIRMNAPKLPYYLGYLYGHLEVINYLLLKRPPYWPPIDTFWPFIDIQLLLQQKCCDNSLLSSIWPLSGPSGTLIWALVSANTLTMTKRMRETSKTVRSVHTEQT